MELGKVVITSNALHTLEQADVNKAMHRYLNHDWGDLGEEDWKANDEALEKEGRILASYKDRNETKFWIITEWDRFATTILLPEDY